MKINKQLLQKTCENMGYPIEFQERKKENRNLTAVTFLFTKEESNASPMFYVEEMEQFFNGDYMSLVKHLVEQAKKFMEELVFPNTFDVKMLENWESIKDIIRATLRHDCVELDSLISVDFCNLHIIFYINIPLNNGYTGMAKITNELFEKWNITVEELCEKAFENCTEFKMAIKEKNATLHTAKEFLLTNEEEDEGVIALAHPGVIPVMAENFDCNLIVLAPSTRDVHIIKTEADELSMSETFSLITQLHSFSEEIPEDMQLSKVPYFYNRKTKTMTVCD